MNRRQFLKALGIGAIGVAVPLAGTKVITGGVTNYDPNPYGKKLGDRVEIRQIPDITILDYVPGKKVCSPEKGFYYE